MRWGPSWSRLRARLRDCEGGQVTVIMGLLMTVGLGFAGLAIDAGNVYLHQKRLKSAVDLALVSGAQKLPDTTTAEADVRSYIDRNWAKTDDTTVTTTTTTGCVNSGCLQPDKVTATATAQVQTTFAKLFGADEFTVKARGAACGPCDASPEKFDVMVVLDRSHSMCRGSNDVANPYTDGFGVYHECPDLDNARDGIRELVKVFNPTLDRIGLTVLSAADSDNTYTGNSENKTAPQNTQGLPAPCESSLHGGSPIFVRSLGDFMDGTPASHDKWVVEPLQGGFKTGDALNNNSPLLKTLACIRGKHHTPIAPAIYEAKLHMLANARTDTRKIIVFFGDGGAQSYPTRRDSNGNALTQNSWYTPTAGNEKKPCADAIAQAGLAKAAGIEIYTIGYDFTATALRCVANNKPDNPTNNIEPGNNARSTLMAMATNSSTHFYERSGPGQVETIFKAIGRKIKGNSVRLIE